MAVARGQLVDVGLTRYCHCISRCVRRAFLCGEGFEHRMQWIEDRLEVPAGSFAVSVCGFSVMDNHLHVLCRVDPNVANAEYWEARMKKLFPKTRLLGSYFATRSERWRAIGAQRGLHHVDNSLNLA